MRSEAICERLALGNAGVSATVVEALEGPIFTTADAIARSGAAVVVSTGDDLDVQCALDEACRAAGVGFIYAAAPGLFAFTFVDLGDEFCVDDERTVEAAPAMLESVTHAMLDSGPVASLTVCDAAAHGLRDGDLVRFSGVQGMEELNHPPHTAVHTADTAGTAGAHTAGMQYREVHVTGPHAFTLGEDTSGYGAFQGGGYVHQMPRPMRCVFRPMAATLYAAAAAAAAAAATAAAGGSESRGKGAGYGATRIVSHATLRYTGARGAAVAPALLGALRGLRNLAPGDDATAFAAAVCGGGGNGGGGTEGDGGAAAEAAVEAVTLLASGAKVEVAAVCTVAGACAAHEAGAYTRPLFSST